MPVARIGLADDVEHQGCVLDGAGHRADMGDGAEGRQRIGGDAAKRRLQAEDAAEAGRNADRAAAVSAEGQRRIARRRCGGRAARRAARGLGHVPWIAGDAGQGRVGDALPAEFRRGGAPQEHRAAFAQAGDAWRILVPGLIRGYGFGAAQGRPAAHQQQILDESGHAIDRALRFALQPAPFAGPGRVHGFGLADFHHGVERRLVAVRSARGRPWRPRRARTSSWHSP